MHDRFLAHMPNFILASGWPANKPDINIPDFSIRVMLEEGQERSCETCESSRSEDFLEKAWEEIPQLPQDHILATVEFYLGRLEAVICAKGGPIERK